MENWNSEKREVTGSALLRQWHSETEYCLLETVLCVICVFCVLPQFLFT